MVPPSHLGPDVSRIPQYPQGLDGLPFRLGPATHLWRELMYNLWSMSAAPLPTFAHSCTYLRATTPLLPQIVPQTLI